MSDATRAAWTDLAALPKPTLSDLFADRGRLHAWSSALALPGGTIRFDWSKTHMDAPHLAGFETLADAAGFAARRAAMFAGEHINVTEDRAVEHTALRGVGRETSVEEAHALHLRMKALVEAIHAGALGEVKHLIHIGIGGSALGPNLAIDALTRDGAVVDVHVVANIDGCALEQAFKACDPATTLIAVASKTFTTTETMTNARSALDWLEQNGVADPFGRVIALTAYPDKAVEWGVDETRVLPFAESVGGRYSLWSSIGFPIALALGWSDFAEFLEGAAAMDVHFRDSDGAANLPLRAAYADLYYTRLRGCQTRAVFAYDERLRLLPSYLQQLEMESNGKSVTLDGNPVDGPTAPITWGGVGTDAQHAVFQLLHQGTNLVPVDFIAAIIAGDSLDPAHHRNLLANCFGQGAALMAGKASTDGARAYPGDRPSATILCEDLNPATLGALIAFHEHRTFCNGVLLGINPFDQFGVELGKEIAKSIVAGSASFDASTDALLAEAGIK
ncbi:glucose-6-phosphate isomerase [Novosphingobium sp.]|uniref:glucose-6-phosphate isomerase n=1 Tax=Novosphingobium sp. TaxID=1874826 RepID=UPI0025F7CF95|nr:glucose-6-phosphate isomerase [Novosphingobium sp.]